MSFSTLRSILTANSIDIDSKKSASPSSSVSPTIDSTDQKFPIDRFRHEKSIAQPHQTSDIDSTSQPKLGNKRKAAFEAWHQKKLAQMKKTDDVTSSTSDSPKSSPPPTQNQSTPKSQLRHFLLSASAPITLESQSIKDGSGVNLATSIQSIPAAAARNLTAPKLSRHNDAAFYPNIQCILCHEWVCSRNRYMHIESHFQYRPYKCSVCGYDNRKQIFIELHISRVHKGAAQILYHPDSELEKRAWTMAEQCLQHTRQVLLRRQMDAKESDPDSSSPSSTSPSNQDKSMTDRSISSPSIDTPIDAPPLMAPYTAVYRPKIYNNQRSEKSNLIEESRQLGLIPDFSDVTAREERCRLCDSHVLRTPALLEEHARTHLSRPSYGCSMHSCPVHHHSRNFIIRHMKEVHRVRRGIHDLLEHDRSLLDEYLATCGRCFPEFFASTTSVSSQHVESKGEKLKAKFGHSNGDQKLNGNEKSKVISVDHLESMGGDHAKSKNGQQSLGSDQVNRTTGNQSIDDHRNISSILAEQLRSSAKSIIDQLGEPDRLKITNDSCRSKIAAGINISKLSTSDHSNSTSINTDPMKSFNPDQRNSTETMIDLPKLVDHRKSIIDKSIMTDQCQGCNENLTLFAPHFSDGKCVSCRQIASSPNSGINFLILICDLCQEILIDIDPESLISQSEIHSLKHCYTLPFQCVHCPFMHWRKSDLNAHFRQMHQGEAKLFFRWQSTGDWQGMWTKTFQDCFVNQQQIDGQKFQMITNDQICQSISKRCGYCHEYKQSIGDQTDQKLINHLHSAHFRLPQLKIHSIRFRQEITTDRAKEFVRSCMEKSQPQSIPDQSISIPKTVFCQLCHLDVPDDPGSHVLHLQYHLQAPIYKCRACPYMDVDVDRIKEHVDSMHQGKVPYYAETLPLDQESKALKLMEWCFRLSF